MTPRLTSLRTIRRSWLLPLLAVAYLGVASEVQGQTQWTGAGPGGNANDWFYQRGGGNPLSNWQTLQPPNGAGAWVRFGNIDNSLNGRNINLQWNNTTVGIFDVTNTSGVSFSINNDGGLNFNNSGSNARLDLFNANSLTISPAVTIGGNNVLEINQNSTGTLTFAGAFNSLSGKTIIQAGSGSVVFNGAMWGDNSTLFRQTGSGTTTVSGASFSLRGEIENGLVQLNNTNNQAFSGGLIIGGAGNTAEVRLLNGNRVDPWMQSTATVREQGILNLNGFNQTLNGVILRGGTVQTGSGMLTLNTATPVTTLASADTAVISGNLALTEYAQTFNVANGAAALDLNVSANISGAFRLVRTGDGVMRLSGNNTFGVTDNDNPGLQLNAGITEFSTDNNLGTANNRVRLQNNATLRAIDTTTLNTNRVLEIGTGGGTVDVVSGQTLTLANTAGRLVGSGTLTREGGGTLRIQGANSGFSGNTLLNDGITRLDNRESLGTGSVTLQNNAELQLTFAVNNNATFGDVTLYDGIIRRTNTTGNDKTGLLNGVSSLEVLGNATLVDSVNNSAEMAMLTVDGAVNVRSGATLTLDAQTAGSQIRLGLNHQILIESGATIITEGSGNIRFGSGSARQIIGEGGSGGEALLRLNATNYAGTNTGTTLQVNGTGERGLRVEGTAAAVNAIANDARLSSISGSGGTLTLAYTDSATRNFTAASNASSPSNVRLGFDAADGSAPVYNLEGDHSNWAGLVLQGGDLNINQAQGTYTQGIVVNGGTLLLGDDNVVTSGTNLTLGGGKLDANNTSNSLGSLTLSANSIIDLSTGSGSILTFGDSSSASWEEGATLQIVNWNGKATGGGTDQLFFGIEGLTSSQISRIVFIDPFGDGRNYAAQLLDTGELVPVPEPAAILGFGALLGFLGWRERQRLIALWKKIRN